jgi:predicted transcriptional regulator
MAQTDLGIKEKIEAACLEVENDTNFEILTEIKAMLNSVYGEERNQIIKPTYEIVHKRLRDSGYWQNVVRNLDGLSQTRVRSYLHSLYNDCISYQIIIHFPEVTIKNDKDEHLIRNMYVRLFLRTNGVLGSYMQGIRTTVTEAEFLSGYLHSHLPRLNPLSIDFHTFCTGIGEINQVLALLNSRYTSANFMMLLMHIKNYLEWESKEGHPYMFMENAFMRSSNMSTYNALSDHMASLAADIIITEMRGHMDIPSVMKFVKFDVTERAITAQSTPDFEKWMATKIERWDMTTLFGLVGFRNSILLSLRDNAGQYYALPEGSRTITYQPGPILNFKGRDIEFEVIERSQTHTNEIFANPKITEETCKKLSRDLTKTALSSPGIKSGSSIIYSTRFTEPDSISV